MAVDYRDLGKRIRKKREENKLSQAELAEKVRLSTQHISNVENAKSKIGLDTLVKIANALNCTLDELVCGSVRNSRSVYHDEIAEILEDFSDVGLRMVPDFLRSLSYAYKVMETNYREENEK